MYVAIVRHRVRNFARWKSVYDADEPRRAAGLGDGRVLQMLGDSRDVVVLVEFADLRKFRAFMRSASVRAAMKDAGVTGKPTIWIARERARRTSRADFGRALLEAEAHPS
jgi:heme-degrading monooxygenase HmoA